MQGKWFLIAGGIANLLASALHLSIIAGGPAWYRFFGAGEQMSRAAERGLWIAPVTTVGIASVLAIWAAYAFSGAGLIWRMPLLRVGLVVISAIYLVRALWLIPGLPLLGRSPEFITWSSLIVLAIGALYAVGTWRAWTHLGQTARGGSR